MPIFVTISKTLKSKKMKLVLRVMIYIALPSMLFFASAPFSGCVKEKVIRDTIVVIKKDTVRITDSVCYNLKDSLVAWYTFNGGSLKDSSGKNNHITFNNATLTSDRFGRANNAYLFDGTSSYMSVPNSGSLNPKNISLVAFVKFNDFYRGTCNSTQIIKKGFRDQVDGIYGLRATPLGQICDQPADTSKEMISGYYGNNQFSQIGVFDEKNFIKASKWLNIVFTYDGTQAKLYVDGELRKTAIGTVPFTPNTDGLFIGRAENPQFPYWFNGIIDEIRIYNKALCDGEVKQLTKLKE
jgi:Concanavalin A-like lectin/glucanases superfamily